MLEIAFWIGIYPGIAETFRRRIERLPAALCHPDGARDAADAVTFADVGLWQRAGRHSAPHLAHAEMSFRDAWLAKISSTMSKNVCPDPSSSACN